ncbi:ATP-binding protein [Streptomyces sp. CMB-StM0423]|uniref:ATP-binding protein n=1 Tax=Streptomyces sp. CMB-StM0423 TaxID=2059884 RepID=UPI000C706112|nr:ATP-binding protein [Streptomyces sp. CMB-StM0423]AUH42086.1 two-component sensor histidine kinase [Streptomyces sp. CMB-StM0423]
MRLNPRALLRRLPFRARLTAAITGLFLLTGTGLLAFVVVLARHGTAEKVDGLDISYHPTADRPITGALPTYASGRGAPGDSLEIRKMEETVQAVQDTALRQMVVWSAVGVLVLALLAGFLGWWLAGRALRPVASMTAAARRISEQNLHQRLALTGPDDELHRLADTFDAMLDGLERAFESQRRFVANASHELKTPLAAQRTSLQVGLADPLPEPLAEVRADLLATNREAERLVDALLLLARSDRGLDETERVDLTATTRLVAADLAAAAGERRVDLTVEAADAALVRGDRVLLRHLLTNVVRNAVQYNHAGGHVRVRIEDRTVTVANTGPPVPAGKIPALFEPFRRLTPDRTAPTPGHGLGLAIAASIAEAHAADLTAAPAPSGGLTVTLRLPPPP